MIEWFFFPLKTDENPNYKNTGIWQKFKIFRSKIFLIFWYRVIDGRVSTPQVTFYKRNEAIVILYSLLKTIIMIVTITIIVMRTNLNLWFEFVMLP